MAEYLRPLFPKVERRRQHGRFDRGDLINTGDWSVECKNTKSIDWSGALDEAVKQQAEVKARWHVVLINRRNHATDKAYAVMTVQQLRELIRTLGDS